MKRRVLCIFILVLWMLVLCTCLAVHIEQLMIPQVTTVKPEDNDPSPDIPLDALFWDDMGMHLYRPREGSGWEKGTRIYEESPGNYTPDVDKIDLQLYGSYIRYASKPLREGDEISIQTENEKLDDTWLAVFPEGVPSYEVTSDAITVTEQTDTALLLTVQNAPQPFMEDRAKSLIPAISEDMMMGERPGTYYSLLDIEQFMAQLPLLASLLGIVLFTVILWGYSCVLSKNVKENRARLIVNGVLAAVLLLCVPLILHFVDLPSSLLPQYRITEIGHYANELREVFTALNGFAGAGHDAAQAALRYAETCRTFAILIAALGILLAALTIQIEGRIGRGKRKPKHAA